LKRNRIKEAGLEDIELQPPEQIAGKENEFKSLGPKSKPKNRKGLSKLPSEKITNRKSFRQTAVNRKTASTQLH